MGGKANPVWNIYEAVILLQAYLKATQNSTPLLRAAKTVSSELRKMAINRGMTISDSFRNAVGLNFQIRSMATAFNGTSDGVPTSALFEETVKIYREDNPRFRALLKEAESMIAGKNAQQSLSDESGLTDCESEYYGYLQNTARLAEKTCIAYISHIRSAEEYARNNGYTCSSLFCKEKATTIATARELYSSSDFAAYNKQKHYCFSAAINKLLEFLGEEIPEMASANITKPVASVMSNSEITNVLKHHYEYGFKYDSIRELMRFRQFANEMDIALPDDDDVLKEIIISSGDVIGEKVYFVGNDFHQELQRIVDKAFSTGAEVIYYECLFEIESEWMKRHTITSPEMLKEYLKRYIILCSFSGRYMVKGIGHNEKESVTHEIKRVWGSDLVESVSALSERLPFIPIGIIARVISGNDSFTRCSEGEYFLVDKLNLSDDEVNSIIKFVDESYLKNGFVSLSEIQSVEIEEEYYELNRNVLLKAIYKKILSDKYHLNKNILTMEKSEMDVVILLRQHISGKEKCSIDEVLNIAMELTGAINRQCAFQALYDDMVRVDRDHFVANRLVNFHVDDIDKVLSKFITDNFRAIRDVTTFAMFPVCGYNWNHYLLESFCYKYSKKYNLYVNSFNDKNAGIIVEKGFNKKYDEMLTIAVARSGVELSPDTIGQYLFNTGYMAKSKFSKLDEIVRRASKLRIEG